MNGLFVSCCFSVSDSVQSLLSTNVLLWSVWPLLRSVMNRRGRLAGPHMKPLFFSRSQKQTMNHRMIVTRNWDVYLKCRDLNWVPLMKITSFLPLTKNRRTVQNISSGWNSSSFKKNCTVCFRSRGIFHPPPSFWDPVILQEDLVFPPFNLIPVIVEEEVLVSPKHSVHSGLRDCQRQEILTIEHQELVILSQVLLNYHD